MLSYVRICHLDNEGNYITSMVIEEVMSPRNLYNLLIGVNNLDACLPFGQIIAFRITPCPKNKWWFKRDHCNPPVRRERRNVRKGLSPKQIKYYPLYEGLACIEDKTGQFLCFPDEVEEILKYLEFTPCVSVCSTGSVKMEKGSWYVFSLKWNDGEYKELDLRSVSIMDDESCTFNYNEKEIQEIGLDKLLDKSEDTVWTMLTFSDIDGKLYYIYFN